MLLGTIFGTNRSGGSVNIPGPFSNDAEAAANTVTATTGTIYAKKYVATGLNTWTVY